MIQGIQEDIFRGNPFDDPTNLGKDENLILNLH